MNILWSGSMTATQKHWSMGFRGKTYQGKSPWVSLRDHEACKGQVYFSFPKFLSDYEVEALIEDAGIEALRAWMQFGEWPEDHAELMAELDISEVWEQPKEEALFEYNVNPHYSLRKAAERVSGSGDMGFGTALNLLEDALNCGWITKMVAQKLWREVLPCWGSGA